MRKLKWVLALAIALWATSAHRPAAADDDPLAPLVNKQIEVRYAPPGSSNFMPVYERLRKRQYLEHIKQFLSPLKIPAGITLKITMKECGKLNSWWTGRQTGLMLCYEWFDFAEQSAPPVTSDANLEREDAIVGSFLQVTFHELGHAMFDIYDVPVFGREEDAADQMAGFILAQFGPEVARRTFPGAARIWRELYIADGGEWPRDLFSDVHGHPLQRAYNYLCMAYGADPGAFQYEIDQGLLPNDRARNCEREFKQIYNAFAQTIYPHIDREKMKIVQSIPWLKPRGQELKPDDAQ